jgi:hypothetical protein
MKLTRKPALPRITSRYASPQPQRGIAETVERAANSLSCGLLQKGPKVTAVATILFLIALTTVSFAQSPTPLQRTPIAVHDIAPPKEVASTSVVRLDFKPGQPTGRHLHPVPVIGFVLKGEFIVKIENEAEKHTRQDNRFTSRLM